MTTIQLAKTLRSPWRRLWGWQYPILDFIYQSLSSHSSYLTPRFLNYRDLTHCLTQRSLAAGIESRRQKVIY